MRLAAFAFYGWRPEPWLVPLLTVLGFILRAKAARDLSLFIDEGFALLGAQSVLTHGIPLIPSGVIYLHGTTLSYLLAPAAALGWANLDHLGLLRAIPVLIGTAVIPLTALLARAASATPGLGVAAAALIAIDPLSIHWSAYVRMYPLLQLIVVGTTLCVIVLLCAPSNSIESHRSAKWLIGLIWIGVFTHLSAAILVVATALLFAARWGVRLPQTKPAVARALAWCVLAPVAQIGISSVFGATTRDAATRDNGLSISFLGDHRVNLTKFLSPDLGPWLTIFPGEMFGVISALLVVAASGIVMIRMMLGPGADVWPRATLLLFYWLPALALILLTNANTSRYFVFVQPLALTILALAGNDLLTSTRDWRSLSRGFAAAVVAIAAILIFRNVQAISTIKQWVPVGIGDQRAAIAKVAELRQPGDLVINQTAVLPYLALGDIPELRYLNRYDEPNEFARYVLFTPAGQPVDYWLGRPAIGTMSDLCRSLADRPGSFLILAETWFAPEVRSGWFGEMIGMIDAATTEVFAADGVVLLRSNPLRQWDKPAVITCSTHGVDIRRDRHDERRPAESGTRGHSDAENGNAAEERNAE